MSSGPQHKMYDYEVAPPPGVWDKIAAELDESELSQKFPSLLYNSESVPPVHVWQKIALTLDEPVLISDYSTKLSAIEVAPPATAWDKIKTSLDAITEIPERRRIAPWIKYAAAAVLIGFMAWGGIRLFGDGTKGNEIATNNNTEPGDNKIIPATPGLTLDDKNIALTNMTAALEEARNDEALEASKKTFAKLDAGVRKTKIKNAADFFFVADDYSYTSPGTTRGISDMFNEPDETGSIDISNRYIVLMTPDGNIIRMSKKLRNLVCCVSGEEMDKDCIDQMKKWRDKIAVPSTHSPGNFLDILSLLSSLQDN